MVPCFICHINSPTRDQLFNILQTPTKEELDSAFSKAKVATRLLSNRNLYQHYLTDVYPRKYIPKHCIETNNDSPINMWNAAHRYIGTLLSDIQVRFRDVLPSQIPHYPHQNNQPTAEHSHRHNTHHQPSNAIQTHRNNRQYNTNPPHRNKSTNESAVHPSHQQNDNDTANSTINTQENFHRSSHHHPSCHTQQQHEHPCATNTNMTYQDHSYTYDESIQHIDPTKTYNEQYEDTSQFSNVSQYNTAEPAHTTNTYSRSNTNPYKPSHQDINVETRQQGWTTNKNNHQTNKPSWGQYQPQHEHEQPHKNNDGWDKYNTSTKQTQEQNTPHNHFITDPQRKYTHSTKNLQSTKTSTVSKSTASSINTTQSSTHMNTTHSSHSNQKIDQRTEHQSTTRHHIMDTTVTKPPPPVNNTIPSSEPSLQQQYNQTNKQLTYHARMVGNPIRTTTRTRNNIATHPPKCSDSTPPANIHPIADPTADNQTQNPKTDPFTELFGESYSSTISRPKSPTNNISHKPDTHQTTPSTITTTTSVTNMSTSTTANNPTHSDLNQETDDDDDNIDEPGETQKHTAPPQQVSQHQVLE